MTIYALLKDGRHMVVLSRNNEKSTIDVYPVELLGKVDDPINAVETVHKSYIARTDSNPHIAYMEFVKPRVGTIVEASKGTVRAFREEEVIIGQYEEGGVVVTDPIVKETPQADGSVEIETHDFIYKVFMSQ